MLEVIATYCDKGKWGYTRVRLSDGAIVLAHRHIMECHIGRKLRSGEVVHHKDQDRSNNCIANLELLNARDHAVHHAPKTDTTGLVCPACGCSFTRPNRYIRDKKKQG